MIYIVCLVFTEFTQSLAALYYEQQEMMKKNELDKLQLTIE